MYGMGIKSISLTIKGTMEEAQKIVDSFYESFPKVKGWIDGSQQMARDLGYVEDIWGRRRRLNDILLPKYEINDENLSSTFNPILFTSGIKHDARDSQCKNLIESLNNAKYKRDVDSIKQNALKSGFKVKDNTGFIAQAERQCANARIQGGAATMSKKAMISVYKDEELRKLGFRLLLAVHDELIGECPIENAEQVKERVSLLMRTAALPECDMVMKCDAEEFKSWYLDEIQAELRKMHKSNIEKGMSTDESIDNIFNVHSEFKKEDIKEWVT